MLGRNVQLNIIHSSFQHRAIFGKYSGFGRRVQIQNTIPTLKSGKCITVYDDLCIICNLFNINHRQ